MGKRISLFLASCVLCVFTAVPVLAATGTVTSFAPAATAFGPNGGNGQVAVSATTAWSATTSTPWIRINSGSSSNTNGTLAYTVSPSSGAGRTGTITIGNQLFTIRQTGTEFTDNTDSTAWQYEYVNALSAAGVTNGCGNNSFCASQSITREEMAAFVIRSLFGENFTYTQNPYFSDVSSTGWSYKYVQKMKDLALTADAGTFNPTGTLTRQEMAAFVIRPLYGENFAYPTTPYFTDVPASNPFFKYIQKMKETGLTTNTGTFNPTGVVTRAQMATVISRAFLGVMPSSSNVFSNNTAFSAGLLMGKTMQFDVPNVGTMTYTFDEDGTFTGTKLNGMMLTDASGHWMINNDGSLTLSNFTGMPGYTENFAAVGGGGVMPMTVNYGNSTGSTGSNVTMTMM